MVFLGYPGEQRLASIPRARDLPPQMILLSTSIKVCTSLLFLALILLLLSDGNLFGLIFAFLVSLWCTGVWVREVGMRFSVRRERR